MSRPRPLLHPSGLALFGAAGAGFFAVAMIIAHAGRPDHDPASHFISELGLGTTAALFATSCWVLGPSILALAAAFHMGLQPSKRRRQGVAFLAAAAVGVILLPVFPMSPPQGYTTPETVVHGTIATAAFLSLNIGVVLVTRALSIDPRYRHHSRPLSGFALVGTGMLVAFIALVAVAEMDQTSPVFHFLGALERVLIAVNLAWCILATGALHHPAGTRGEIPLGGEAPVARTDPVTHATGRGGYAEPRATTAPSAEHKTFAFHRGPGPQADPSVTPGDTRPPASQA